MKQMEDDVSRLIQNFSRFSHFIKRRSRNADLRTGEIAILRCIMHHTDGPDGEYKALADQCADGACRQPSITPSLRSLEERGYVRRRNSDQDRREVYFSVTEKTREMGCRGAPPDCPDVCRAGRIPGRGGYPQADGDHGAGIGVPGSADRIQPQE